MRSSKATTRNSPVDHVEQFSGSKEELRSCRSPEALISDRERLVDQYTCGGNRRDQLIQDRPVQVVRDDHPANRRSRSRERLTVLEIDLDDLESIVFPDVIETGDVSIDGDNVAAAVQEQPGMATGAARDVEDLVSGRDQGCEADDPR
jgi:hypothetical protein